MRRSWSSGFGGAATSEEAVQRTTSSQSATKRRGGRKTGCRATDGCRVTSTLQFKARTGSRRPVDWKPLSPEPASIRPPVCRNPSAAGGILYLIFQDIAPQAKMLLG